VVERGVEVVIPARRNRRQPREHDREMYKERHLIECCINKMKQYRRVFSRFDKLDSRYLGFVWLVGSLIWLR
jgi:transposase